MLTVGTIRSPFVQIPRANGDVTTSDETVGLAIPGRLEGKLHTRVPLPDDEGLDRLVTPVASAKMSKPPLEESTLIILVLALGLRSCSYQKNDKLT
jgi:hypothetical protein